MDDVLTSLAGWFSARPHWLQIAAARFLQQTELTEKDFFELVILCKQEAEGKLPKTACSFPVSTFAQSSTGTLRLCSISDIAGINALAPQKPLEFGKGNITVIYGNNGSGKSGYVRLLKHACGARKAGTLHCDVYKPKTTAQKACILFEQDGIPQKYTWLGQGSCDELNSIVIFDASSGNTFVSSEDEVSYEPIILSFFSSLIFACEKVSSILDAQTGKLLSKKPNIPIEKKVTPEGVWYESLSAKTSTEEINAHCVFGSSDETEIQTLQQRLAEQAPEEKAKLLRKQKQHTDALIQDAKKFIAQLSDENCRRIIAAKKKAALIKAAADTAAEKVFSSSGLEGIGSDVWKELWKAARNYSTSFAYKEVDFPNVADGSLCVLCQQPLTQEGKNRLMTFESFVKGEMQKSATNAAKEYEAASQSIEILPTLEDLKTRIDAAGIIDDNLASQIIIFFTELHTRKKQLQGIDCDEAIPTPITVPNWIEEATNQSKSLEYLALKYDEDAKSGNRGEVKNKLNSLLTRKWLSENRRAVEDEVTRFKLLDHLQKAKNLTNTKSLSQKKGELAEALITDAFVQRFNAELKALCASHVKVELVKTKTSKGRVLHKLQLRGASQNGLVDILSEGESRIVSIAAFLADVTSNNSKAPFIFDDPISSLDQSYEEAVVKRLIELSQDKQVIVFTHRLSLLAAVKHFAEKMNIKTEVVSVRSADWGTGEPAPIPLSQSDIKSALNALMNKRFFDAKKANEDGNFENAEILLKSICSDFRIWRIQLASATPSKLNEKARWYSPLASPSNQRLRGVWAMHTLPGKNGTTSARQ